MSNMQASPMYPKVPPNKKQRSNQGVPLRGGGRPSPVDAVGDATNDAVVRRRQTLQNLRQQQQRSATSTQSGLLAKARNLNFGGGPPLKSSLKSNGGTTSDGQPKMPNPRELGPRRESDIFPHVEKSPNQAKPIKISLPPADPIQIPNIAPLAASAGPPIRPTSAAGAPPISNASSIATPSVDPSTIARRLDFASGSKQAPPPPDRSKSAPPARPPPPPTPKLVQESPAVVMNAEPQDRVPRSGHPMSPTKEAMTSVSPRPSRQSRRPPPITPMMGDGPSQPGTTKSSSSSSRREFLSSMAEYADSPSASAKSKNSELKLIRELKKVHTDKEDAFRQVVRLREQIAKLQKQDRKEDENRQAEDFQQLVDLANRDGDRAALRFARERASSVKKTRRGMYPQSPLSSRSRTASPSRRAMNPGMGPGVRKRVSTPHPKRTDMNGEEDKFLAKATETNPDEFDSDVATYIVRRPYTPHNEELWNEVGELSTEDYKGSANVGKPMSLEICAKIKADGSVLILSGMSSVRHKKPRGKKWKIFDNVDALDKPMGSVMFIDGEANEGEYWLDEIYEEAMSTRDTYCSSLISTATALKTNVIQQATVESQQQFTPEQATTSSPATNGSEGPPVTTMPPTQQQEQLQPPVATNTTNGPAAPFMMMPPTQQPVATNMNGNDAPPMMMPPMQQPTTAIMNGSGAPPMMMMPPTQQQPVADNVNASGAPPTMMMPPTQPVPGTMNGTGVPPMMMPPTQQVPDNMNGSRAPPMMMPPTHTPPYQEQKQMQQPSFQEQPQMQQPPFQEHQQMQQPPFQEQPPMQQPPFQEQQQMQQPPFQEQPPMQQPLFQEQPQMQQPPFQEQQQMQQPPMQQQQPPLMQQQPSMQQQSPAQEQPPMQQQQPPSSLEKSDNSAAFQPEKAAETLAPKNPHDEKKAAPKGDTKKKEENKEAPKKKKKAAPAPEEEEAASDMLSVLLGMFFLGIYNFIQFIFVTVIWGGIKMTVFCCILGVVLSVAWSHLADDGGAGLMGAGMGYGFNRAGIV